MRACWVALDPIRLRIFWILDTIDLTASQPIFSNLICLQQAKLLHVPSTSLSEKSLTGLGVDCQSDKWGWWRDSIPRLCLECSQPHVEWWVAPENGNYLTRRAKGKDTLDPPDKAFLTVCLSSFSLCVFLLLFSHLYFLLPSPSPAPSALRYRSHTWPHVSERKLIQLFRNKSEFTFLATVQQKPSRQEWSCPFENWNTGKKAQSASQDLPGIHHYTKYKVPLQENVWLDETLGLLNTFVDLLCIKNLFWVKWLSCLLSKDHSWVSFSPILYLLIDFAHIKPHSIHQI